MSTRYRKILVSAPGKLILMGEHAAVYGQPALVAAVGPRAEAEVEQHGSGVRFELVDLDLQIETDWQALRDHADRSRLAWQRYADQPTPERFAEIGAGQPTDLVKVALGEVACRHAGDLPPISGRISSRLPVGSGFGSSASIAVALVGAILTLVEGEADLDTVDRLVFEVERRQHGLPSGIDHKTVLRGGVVVALRRPEGELEISELAQQSPILGGLEVYQTGQPVETTGAVVAAVRRRRDEQPEATEWLFNRMGREVAKVRRLLESRRAAVSNLTEPMRSFESCLEALGVVPAVICETIRQIERAGGAAKISGAGALTGSGAGCLLVFWPDGPPAEPPDRLRTWQRLAVDLGVEGMRVEERQ